MVYAGNLCGWRRGLRTVLLLCAMLCLGWQQPAMARRAALVIGNSSYVHANPLPNPASDSRLVAAAAANAGFEVTLVNDLTRAGFDEALRQFRTKADGAEVAMIYFAGHGIESSGTNWLIPTDATLKEARDLRFEAIELDGLLETLNGAQLRMVILDACRDNPFGTAWRNPARTVAKGLAETEVTDAIVMYAASGGQLATDGAGSNSPFARSLARRMVEPGLSIHRFGSVIRADVLSETAGKQSPWTNMSIDGREFFLVARQSDPATGVPDRELDNYAWRLAEATNTIPQYQEYLGKFPNGMFVRSANEKIAALRAGGVPGALSRAPLPGVRPPPSVVSPGMAAVFAAAYPGCREDYQVLPNPRARIAKITECLTRLDQFASGALTENAAAPGYGEAKSRFEQDRAYLQRRYCAYSGTCNGK